MWPFLRTPLLKSWECIRDGELRVEADDGRVLRVQVGIGVFDAVTGKSVLPEYSTIFGGKYGGVVRRAYWEYDDTKKAKEAAEQATKGTNQ